MCFGLDLSELFSNPILISLSLSVDIKFILLEGWDLMKNISVTVFMMVVAVLLEQMVFKRPKSCG